MMLVMSQSLPLATSDESSTPLTAARTQMNSLAFALVFSILLMRTARTRMRSAIELPTGHFFQHAKLCSAIYDYYDVIEKLIVRCGCVHVCMSVHVVDCTSLQESVSTDVRVRWRTHEPSTLSPSPRRRRGCGLRDLVPPPSRPRH